MLPILSSAHCVFTVRILEAKAQGSCGNYPADPISLRRRLSREREKQEYSDSPSQDTRGAETAFFKAIGPRGKILGVRLIYGWFSNHIVRTSNRLKGFRLRRLYRLSCRQGVDLDRSLFKVASQCARSPFGAV